MRYPGWRHYSISRRHRSPPASGSDLLVAPAVLPPLAVCATVQGNVRDNRCGCNSSSTAPSEMLGCSEAQSKEIIDQDFILYMQW